MPMAVLTNFAMPLILIVLASIVLGERIPKWRWAATAIGFLGIAVIFKPHGDVYHWALVPLILSAFCFALLDVLNRRYANSESMWAMLFYVFMGTALLAAIPAAYCWQSPTAAEWFLVALMAVGANLLSFCSMRALRLIEASATAPYRYVEFLFSIVTGYVFFGEIISRTTLFGAAIILPTTVLIAIYEARNSSKK
jgi:S-adenosylmethionine uptake transporter